jgi:hypothetical protein
MRAVVLDQVVSTNGISTFPADVGTTPAEKAMSHGLCSLRACAVCTSAVSAQYEA